MPLQRAITKGSIDRIAQYWYSLDMRFLLLVSLGFLLYGGAFAKFAHALTLLMKGAGL